MFRLILVVAVVLVIAFVWWAVNKMDKRNTTKK